MPLESVLTMPAKNDPAQPARARDSNGSRRMRGIFLVVALVLIGSGVATYFFGRLLLDAIQALSLRQSEIDELREVLSTLKDAETGQRGFLLSGNDLYLQPYNDARAKIAGELNALDRLTADGRLPKEKIVQLNRQVQANMDELQFTIDARKTMGFDAAVAIVMQDTGKRIMDDIRDLIDSTIQEENGRLRQLSARVDRLTHIRILVFLTAILCNLGFVYWAYRRIRKEAALLQTANNELREQKELIGVTLASIGDGVIVTDKQGRVIFLNAVAETLTGWSLAEARQRPCAEVFQIVNETTRKIVESPVDKVLRLGVVIGLANHTVLIRHNGSEIPIDDSGAPIRDAHGNMRGVVLVFRDFTDHKRFEANLIRAKEDAEAANIAKDNFLATLSHELRTPLTPVSATLSAWVNDQNFPAALLDDVHMMRRNVDFEARLIDDLLDLTRIVRGKLSLNPEMADIHGLLGWIATMYQSDIHAKRLDLTLKLEAGQFHVYADPARLQQVFWNILKNATKFTPEGGRIDVRTSVDQAGRVRVSFEDTGIGMTPELIARIFQPFEQGTDESVRRYGGLGLGMAISKALMEAQGGSITAESKGLGEGSTFTIAMPLAKAPVSGSVAADSPSAVKTSRRLRILLVEDHIDTARAMAKLLRMLGHEVALAETVAEALASVAAGDFELIVSDIGLPDGTGLDLIRQIRTTSNIAAIALTGFGMEEDVAKCREAGFQDHLTKPVNFQKLEMAIDLASQRLS